MSDDGDTAEKATWLAPPLGTSIRLADRADGRVGVIASRRCEPDHAVRIAIGSNLTDWVSIDRIEAVQDEPPAEAHAESGPTQPAASPDET